MLQEGYSLSIIIPAFNEARRLPKTLAAVQGFAESCAAPVELIVVDDGSSDDTRSIPPGFGTAKLKVQVIVNQQNQGKGYSVKAGMLAATGDLLLMSDADLSTPLTELPKLKRAIDEGYDVVFGSREMPDSKLDPPQPKYRRLMGGIFAMMRSALLVRGFVDSQCGFKLFKRDAAKRIFERLQTDGYAFDCEVLARAVRMGLKVKEVGITWHNDPDSRIHPIRDSLRMFASLIEIRANLRREQTRR